MRFPDNELSPLGGSKILYVLGKYRSLFIVIQLIFVVLSSHTSGTSAHSPHDVVDWLDISPTYDKDKTLFIIILSTLLKSTDGGFSWKQIVKGLDNKFNLSSVAISPYFNVDKTVFATTNGDGIYKSQDGGSSWFKENKGLADLSIHLLVISSNYSSDETVLAAGHNGALYKSENGGESWYQVMDGDIKVTAVAFYDGRKKNHILVGDQRGTLYLSTDGGDVWRQWLRIPNSGAITSIAISSNASLDNTTFVGTEKQGIFRIVDGDASYGAVNKGLAASPSQQVHVTSLAISPNYQTDSTIFASTWHRAVYRSNNGGNTWKKYSRGVTINPQADEPQFMSAHFRHLRISKTFRKDRTLFLGGFDGLFMSTDGGNVWTQMETLSLKPVTGLAFSPAYRSDSTIAIATFDGGAYITDDDGTTWEVVNRGLLSTHLWDITFSPDFSSDNNIFAISNFAFYKSTDRGKTWERIVPRERRSIISRFVARANRLLRRLLILRKPRRRKLPPVFPWTIAISPYFAFDNTIYFGTRYEGVFRSASGGITWSPIWKAGGGWISSLVISPDFSSDNTLYAGVQGQGVYKTVDQGSTWQTTNNDLTTIARRHKWGSVLLAISPNYKTDRTVFAGTAEGLFKSVDRGEGWQKLDVLAYGSNGYIKAVAISPNYQADKTIMITVKGQGLFKSTDGGKTFFKLAHHLINNNHSLTLIRFSPAYSFDRTIYGASQEDLFKSGTAGNTWKPIARPIRYEDRKQVIDYQGAWHVLRGRALSARSVTYSFVANDKATLRFVGTSIAWIGTKADNQGIAKVSVDRVFKAYVDQFSHICTSIVRLYSISGLGYGPHTIEIEVTGTKNPNSKGYRIEIDAFDVVP